MDPFEKNILDILARRKEVAKRIVSELNKKTQQNDINEQLPYDIYKTNKCIKYNETTIAHRKELKRFDPKL